MMVSMKKNLRLVCQALILMAVLLLAATASAQSLGEAARRLRAKKGKQPKATRVYNNDNLPSSGGLSTTGLEAQAKAMPGEKAKKGGKEEPEVSKESRAELEKGYGEKFAKLREALALEEKKLGVLKREFNLANVQFYSDPNVALREQTARGELAGRQQELESQKGAVASARKAITDLQEELRRKGLPAGWAR